MSSSDSSSDDDDEHMSSDNKDDIADAPINGDAGSDTKPVGIRKKWINRTRVLVFCSRGCTSLQRHLMTDLRALMPHAKAESKLDTKHDLPVINEIAAMQNCTKCVFFESRKGQDLYVWLADVQRGPSVKFLVHNVHTMAELKLSGNCLRGSRPLVVFQDAFDKRPHLRLIKELLAQTFNTPKDHPKSQPFVDHIINFSITPDQKIWFRNYQIVEEQNQRLEEIGPRMVLELIKIFDGSFGGSVLYENTNYVAPNLIRRQMKMAKSSKYSLKVNKHKDDKERRQMQGPTVKTDPFDAVFNTRQGARDEDSTVDPTLEALANDLRKPVRDRKKAKKRKLQETAQS